MSLPCIVCLKPLEDALYEPSTGNQPHAGTAFVTTGHYGSTIYDPMDGSWLEVNICDPCIRLRSKDGFILRYPPEGSRRAKPKVWKAPE